MSLANAAQCLGWGTQATRLIIEQYGRERPVYLERMGPRGPSGLLGSVAYHCKAPHSLSGRVRKQLTRFRTVRVGRLPLIRSRSVRSAIPIASASGRCPVSIASSRIAACCRGQVSASV